MRNIENQNKIIGLNLNTADSLRSGTSRNVCSNHFYSTLY